MSNLNDIALDSIPSAIAALAERWYLAEVADIAQSIYDRIKSGELDSEDYSDAVYEACDGNAAVIYTWQARCVAMGADDLDDYESEFGSPATTPEALACFLLTRDVTATVADMVAQAEGGEA